MKNGILLKNKTEKEQSKFIWHPIKKKLLLKGSKIIEKKLFLSL
jgi:hypothetical protein